MSLFINWYLLFAALNLTVQIVVLLLLIYGVSLKMKKQFLRHARVMTTAVAAHLTMVFSFMIPSFVLALVPVFVIPHVYGLPSIVSLIHTPLGLAALSLGLWLVLSWRFRGLNTCPSRKKYMVAELTIWSLSLAYGIILFSLLYWTALMG